MGECIIVGRASGSSGGDGTTLISQIFLENTIWKVPKIANQNFSVRIFGGGGGCGAHVYSSSSSSLDIGGGGGGGFMNNAILELSPGEEIQITIGAGGSAANTNVDIAGTGGTTFFGHYLSALGGTGGGSVYIDNIAAGVGGYGGSGGGSFGINGYSSNLNNNHLVRYSGTGFQFGGGGGSLPGNGGYWGGGGGGYDKQSIRMNRICGYGGCIYNEIGNLDSFSGFSGYAGNGKTQKLEASDGTNTIGLGLEFEGAGLVGSGNRAGGGGYGGNGGNGGNNTYAGPGGGGYGANGGSCSNASTLYDRNSACGGGGYGGDGGSAGAGVKDNTIGGGGGYGKYGTGGGLYSANGGIAAGGGMFERIRGSGGDGICIIQYYI